MAKQSCLEVTALDERRVELNRNDYLQTDQYSSSHRDAISDGDVQGKGSGYGGHLHSIPDCSRGRLGVDLRNFDTRNFDHIGGAYDIYGRTPNGQISDGSMNGRMFLMNINKFDENTEYNANYVDTTENVLDGQIVVR